MRTLILGLVLHGLLGSLALSGPVVFSWPVEGPDDCAAIAAAAFTGWSAAGDSYEDSVEIRGPRGELAATIIRAQLTSALPWMSLGGGPDGPCGLAWSDSGRSLFILVADSSTPGDGLGSDAVLRYDTFTGGLSVFARLELANDESNWPHLGAAHFKGKMYVGTTSQGVKSYLASSGASSGLLVSTQALPDGGAVHGIAVDRDAGLLYAASNTNIYRASTAPTTPVFSLVGALAAPIRALAYSDHFGGTSNAGLYALTFGGAPTTSALSFLTVAQSRGQATFAPSMYYSVPAECHALAATAEGQLLVGADEDALRIADTSDSRLPLDGWAADEFDQVVAFSKGLISPDGEPPGWVIDADVQLGWSRFHPATPDGACWTTLALLMADHVNNDPEALPLVRQILIRYAGLAPDGIGASASPDGYLRHWIDPATGGTKPGWPEEFAVYSAMKILIGAERAMAYAPTDQVIEVAGSRIACRVSKWDSYIQPGIDAVYLVSRATGGPDPGPRNFPFTEGIHFAEQASVYGGASSDASFARWINRALWPTASYVPGRTVTSDSANRFLPAFITGYSLLLQRPFRDDAAWRAHVKNLFDANGAWSDDFGPRYFTVFSAGTTRSDWGGYHADSLSDHPGNVTSFPSLLAFCADGSWAPALAAYQAYRKGARQTFLGGASILYRRSDVDRAYQPDSAGLPDVVLGGLGLAELLRPGAIDAVLARTYSPYACPPDVNADGLGDAEDLYLWHDVPVDLDRDGVTSSADEAYLRAYVRRHEKATSQTMLP